MPPRQSRHSTVESSGCVSSVNSPSMRFSGNLDAMNICTGPVNGNLSPSREQKDSTAVALGIGYGSTKKAPSSLSVLDALAFIHKVDGRKPFCCPCSEGTVNMLPSGGNSPVDEIEYPLPADDTALELPMNTLAPFPTRARKVNAMIRPIESPEIWTAEPPEEALVVVKRNLTLVAVFDPPYRGWRPHPQVVHLRELLVEVRLLACRFPIT